MSLRIHSKRQDNLMAVSEDGVEFQMLRADISVLSYLEMVKLCIMRSLIVHSKR